MKALLRGMIFGIASLHFGSTTPARELTLEQRIAAQRAIEQVYWSHRAWPKENVKPKPSLDDVMPESVLRAKVEDYLKKSNALEKDWGRPITEEQLEAETDRMASSTKAPDVLQEIFEALGGDRFVIAETLARQTLADRLIRNWYAWDDRFHGGVKRRAERSLARLRSTSDMRSLGGRYTETTWKLDPNESEGPDPSDQPGVIRLGTRGWQDLLNKLEGQFGAAREGGSGIVPSRLVGIKSRSVQEGREAFYATAVLRAEDGAVTTATVTWPKTRFDSWWSTARNSMGVEVEPSPGLPGRAVVSAKKCQDDTWTAVATEVPEPRHGHTAVWTGKEMIVWGGMGAAFFDTGGRYNPATDTWVPTSTTSAPSARYRHTAVWTGKEMIVWGGSGPGGLGELLGTGGRYDPETDSWSPTGMDGSPTARRGHTAVWTGREMIVWGGVGSPWQLFGTGARYDPATDGWTPTSVLMSPAARTNHTTVWTGSEMIVWGGAGALPWGSPFGPLDTGGRYSPATDTWTPTSTFMAPDSSYWHTAVWTGREMIISGNMSLSCDDLESTEAPEGDAYRTGGRYDPTTDTWTPTKPYIWGATEGSLEPNGSCPLFTRREQTVVWTGSEMITWGGGGLGDGFGSAIEGVRYDPDTDTWTATNWRGAPPPRSEHTAVWTGSEMIVWGGEEVRSDSLVSFYSSGGRYNPVSDTWVPTSTGTAPSARMYHTAVWTGSEAIVWGGFGDSGRVPNEGWPEYEDLNTGGRYTPATDTWSPVRNSGAPSARDQHTAVWTGKEMIVWGGAVTTYYGHSLETLGTGGRYDPAADTWAVTSANEAPSARERHTAIWTGREMIVWGGSSSPYVSTGTNTGGRYDPERDTWVAMNSDGAPNGVVYHAAVWTGREMIVWGGLSPANYWPGYRPVDAGARYDPETDTWTRTNTDAAPTARWGHAAVWTGSEMMVWGGLVFDPWTGASYFDTGGRYDPLMDSWRPMSTAMAPNGRAFHSAVWTGREMIVWGGSILSNSSESNLTNTGGRYDPASDGWTATSTDRAPSARYVHPAVWTGSEMIVLAGWGIPYSYYASSFDYAPLASGGRYCARGNSPPIASAGPDRTIECDGDLRAVARLDGSGSSDPDSTPGTNDDIERFDWSEGGVKLGSGAEISKPLTLGTHTVALDVTDTVGESDKDEALFTVKDGLPPAGKITAPLEGECFGPPRLPVILEDDFTDRCDPSLGRTYDPSPGPSYGDHGDHAVTLAVRDSVGNEARAIVNFTVDTRPPTVEILSPPDRKVLAPSALPLSILFRSSDEDGATGRVVHEVIKLAGCTIYDGLTYGDGDGLLSDENISLTRGELCRVSVLCGFARLDQPELRVEATDCGGNVGFAVRRFQGSLLLSPGVCGR